MSQLVSSPNLLTLEEIATYLRVPRKTVYHWVSRNEIPYLKVGRHLRFDAQVVINFFEKLSSERRSPCLYSPSLIINRGAFRSLKSREANSTSKEGVES